MAEKKKFSLKKAIVVAGCLTAVGLSAFFGIKALTDKPTTNPPQTPPGSVPQQPAGPGTEVTAQKLATPVLKFDEKTDTLSWAPVKNAVKYVLTVNGKPAQTTKTTHVLNLEEDKPYTITVEALGDGVNYTTSNPATLSGYKQNEEYMAYKNIKENIKEMFSIMKYAGGSFELHEILTVDFKDNHLITTVKCNAKGGTNVGFQNIDISLSKYYQVSNTDINEVSNASDYLCEAVNDSNFEINSLTNVNKKTQDCQAYDNLISDPALTGSLREYLNDGYQAEKIFSETIPGLGKEFTVKSQLKLTKGNDTKIVYVENQIKQKFNNAWVPLAYCEAYANGTAEDVTITETKFEEYTPFASLWDKTEEKFKNYVEKQAETQAQSAPSGFYINLGGQTYKVTSAPSYSPEM